MFQSYQEASYLLATVYEKENRQRDARKQLHSLIELTQSFDLSGGLYKGVSEACCNGPENGALCPG